MELIEELFDSDIDPNWVNPSEETATRMAARAVVMNDLGEIALLYVSGDDYYKLPGGGVDAGEGVPDALHREIREETGAAVEVLGEVGLIVEHRGVFNMKQLSYCFLARTVGVLQQPAFTEEETRDGFRLYWVPFGKAEELLAKGAPQSYHGRYIQVRDLAFLRQAVGKLENGVNYSLPEGG